MKYIKYSITSTPELADILLAFLSELPFDMFEEKPDGLNAFIPETDHTDQVIAQLDDLSNTFNVSFSKEIILPQNWNATWESNFQPIIVGDFCAIRADFHAPIPNVEHEIIINPKMAFGTGHHATTYMVIEQMKSLDFKDKEVFDYGCGTGILAILASKLGATTIDAVDIEEASFENTIENAKNNGIANIRALLGTLEAVKKSGFDIILANINRNVILDSLPALYEMLNKNGKLIVSGFVEQDTDLLLHASEKQGFSPLNTQNKDNWISIAFEK